MDLKLLEHFAAVADELSFTRAAVKLHLSRSVLQTRARRPELVDLRVTAEKVAATTNCRVWPDSSVHRLR
ncbi:LysR family transcriptional regulator [Frankia sp. Cr1]|uniref:LysR family transcriptional regulator n=1 Tax=Frankia sp. Cr1 TaxID=3073931 RepID=UPI002AD1FEE3|nr:LysR family transcriptional regulator [Frankia sp. Cr1]